ncbi:TetR/AcrR family transcriptional regulator [Actinomycetota bacterium]
MPRGDSSPERIVDVALILFAAHGVAGTSLQMIADELGVTKAAVYHHFRTKDAIVDAAIAPAMHDFVAMLEESAPHPAEVRAGIVVDRIARQAVRHRRLYAVVLRDLSARRFIAEVPERREVFRRLREALTLGNQPDAAVRAAIFLSGLDGPHVDPDVAGLDDSQLEAVIADVGRRILGLAPR